MWNHNVHYHSYLLRQISSRIDRALDIGCGLGFFSWKLSKRSEIVDALDIDGAVLAEASILNPAPNISYVKADFLIADLPAVDYDVIVLIAVLHHMDIEAALKRVKRLLRSSGKLLILGLYQEKTLLDYAYSVISIPLNFVYSRWHRPSITRPTVVAPTRPPQLSLQQIKRVAEVIIPGFRLQRHLFWRYSLIWQKP
jgi:ubiquinone/menaquinone biosynthesis C-methylase UbiE